MNSDIVIHAEGLGKKYVIGHQSGREKYTTLRDAIGQAMKGVARSAKDMARGKPIIAGDTLEEYWALRDINFKIKRGEVVGIIGRNGAGKSTLLKVLSRITDPSEGRVKIKGRISSLLEVGTGFHPELTGRENVFLNGAILGMTQAEIRCKFDEIVAFSEIEKFLDTPVKRYSSGMYVRLAFAVAAHLEPEILVVDEVLAVGDALFQNKCIGKMQDVSKEGRTVLFVSHNMAAVRKLCSRAIMLNEGTLLEDSDVNHVVEQYLSYGQSSELSGEIVWNEVDAPSCREIALQSIRVLGTENRVLAIYDATKPISVEIRFQVKVPVVGMRIVLGLLTSDGVVAFASTNHSLLDENQQLFGHYTTKCIINADLLNNGSYTLNLHVGIPGVKVLIRSRDYLSFVAEGAGGHGSNYTEKWPGVVSPKLCWSIESNAAE